MASLFVGGIKIMPAFSSSKAKSNAVKKNTARGAVELGSR